MIAKIGLSGGTVGTGVRKLTYTVDCLTGCTALELLYKIRLLRNKIQETHKTTNLSYLCYTINIYL